MFKQLNQAATIRIQGMGGSASPFTPNPGGGPGIFHGFGGGFGPSALFRSLMPPRFTGRAVGVSGTSGFFADGGFVPSSFGDFFSMLSPLMMLMKMFDFGGSGGGTPGIAGGQNPFVSTGRGTNDFKKSGGGFMDVFKFMSPLGMLFSMFKHGGPVSGSFAKEVPIVAHAGEFVLTQEATRVFGAQALQTLNDIVKGGGTNSALRAKAFRKLSKVMPGRANDNEFAIGGLVGSRAGSISLPGGGQGFASQAPLPREGGPISQNITMVVNVTGVQNTEDFRRNSSSMLTPMHSAMSRIGKMSP